MSGSAGGGIFGGSSLGFGTAGIGGPIFKPAASKIAPATAAPGTAHQASEAADPTGAKGPTGAASSGCPSRGSAETGETASSVHRFGQGGRTRHRQVLLNSATWGRRAGVPPAVGESLRTMAKLPGNSLSSRPHLFVGSADGSRA
jgi:hypothetical protein